MKYRFANKDFDRPSIMYKDLQVGDAFCHSSLMDQNTDIYVKITNSDSYYKKSTSLNIKNNKLYLPSSECRVYKVNVELVIYDY